MTTGSPAAANKADRTVHDIRDCCRTLNNRSGEMFTSGIAMITKQPGFYPDALGLGENSRHCENMWGSERCAPSEVQGQNIRSVAEVANHGFLFLIIFHSLNSLVRGPDGEAPSPQKLKVFRCISIFLGSIVEIHHLDAMFTVTARA